MLRRLQKAQIHSKSNLLVSRLLLVFIVAIAACTQQDQPIKPQRRDVVQAVYASGKVYPANYYRAVSGLPGYLEELLVKVGDTVKVGQPLFRVRNETSELAVRTAENNLRLAREYAAEGSPYLSALKFEVNAARAKYKLDSLNLDRLEALQRQNAGTAQQLDVARTSAATSKDIWQKALANLAATIKKLKTDCLNAENQLNAARSQQADFTIVATINGRVYDILPKVGELIGPQVPVMELGSIEGYEVELAIDESDANFVKPGQPIVFSAEFLNDMTLKGRVEMVYPKIAQLNKSIKAIASISPPADVKIYAGSTVEANIVYRERKQVLVLPRFYVLNDTVLVKSGLSQEKRKIKTGASDVEYVEILSGLSESEEVLRP